MILTKREHFDIIEGTLTIYEHIVAIGVNHE